MRDPEKAKAKRAELKSRVDNIKKRGECSVCGNEDHRVLEFHHRDPTQKKFSIVKAVHNRYSLNALQKEIEKCDLICANCHRVIHYGDNDDDC